MTVEDRQGGDPADEIVRRHVEAPWPPYRGRDRVGSQCAFCNRTWPCDAARLLAAAATPALSEDRPEAVWTPPAFTVERLAEILHDLDGTQHYVTHETSYDGDDMEGVECIGGVESHLDDARELLVSLQGEMEAPDL